MPAHAIAPMLDEPPQSSEDMTKRDLIEVLQHLPLRHRTSTCLLEIDRGVRDYLVRVLKQQH